MPDGGKSLQHSQMVPEDTARFRGIGPRSEMFGRP
jgi:hypothetical protein